MKRMFYFSGALFFLSLTLLVGVHIGQQKADAQQSQKVVAITYANLGQHGYAVTLANGDVYWRRGDTKFFPDHPPSFLGNFWQ